VELGAAAGGRLVEVDGDAVCAATGKARSAATPSAVKKRTVLM
jgi:hypothetical protein